MARAKKKKQRPVRHVPTEILNPKHRNLGSLGLAMQTAARAA